MNLVELVRAAMREETLVIRQWVADAQRSHIRWSQIDEPIGLNRIESVVAAALVGLLAERAHEIAPHWVESTPPADEPIWLDSRARRMPRTRAMIEQNCPAPLRSKGVFASDQFMTIS